MRGGAGGTGYRVALHPPGGSWVDRGSAATQPLGQQRVKQVVLAGGVALQVALVGHQPFERVLEG